MSRKRTTCPAIADKARQLLEFAEQRAAQAADWLELHRSLFGLGGKANELFPTEAERTAFLRTPECKRIAALMDTLPSPPVKGCVSWPPSSAR